MLLTVDLFSNLGMETGQCKHKNRFSKQLTFSYRLLVCFKDGDCCSGECEGEDPYQHPPRTGICKCAHFGNV